MADTKISDLPAATTVADADLATVVQSGTNKKSALSVIKTYLTTAFNAIYVPLTRTLTIGGSAKTLAADRSWTTSDILDSLGSTQGDVLIRSNSAWIVLAPGTDGNVLTTHSASFNPTWETPTAPAPTTAHYVTTQSEGSLTNEFNLGALTTGLLKHSVTGSVSTPATASAGTDYTDNAFKTIAVSGQSDVVADSAADTLTFAAGTNITLTTNASTDTVTITAAGSAQVHAVTMAVDGSGSVLSTGTKNAIKIPFGGTLTGWLLNGSPSGSVTVDIFRSADGAGLPVTSIVGGGGTKPSLSSATENSSTSFTSWTSTTLTAKDNLAISLSGITASTYVSLTLYFS